MADIRIDSRDLTVILDALNGMMEDGDFDLGPSERVAYERLCRLAGVDPIEPFEQQSLGFLEDEPEPPRRSGRGIMADYIDRARHFGRGDEGLPWPPKPEPPKPDPAKQIAEKMARASKDAAEGKLQPREKRALTDEQKEAVRRALDGDE